MAYCEPVSMSAAFLIGLAGSAHCFAMCGGLSSALALRARGALTGMSAPPPAAAAGTGARTRTAQRLLALQAGRITSYVLMGTLIGAFGQLLVTLFDLERLAILARVASGLVLLAVAATLLTGRRPLVALERLGGSLWRHLVPLARHIRVSGNAGSWLLGMLWGGFPCGFLYTMLLFAALRGSAMQAGLMLASFGLGTLPALLGAGFISAHLKRLWPRVAMPSMAGWVLLVCGAWTLFGAWVPGHH
ncbi:MAG TPA: sulfite exporter TauE/SafE family protein [Steroidobacteraceae bacterium]|nr:sulfite exporter TauE/SafE family protein [Steroidobacteraceae bacterium]